VFNPPAPPYNPNKTHFYRLSPFTTNAAPPSGFSFVNFVEFVIKSVFPHKTSESSWQNQRLNQFILSPPLTLFAPGPGGQIFS
jgi:hypothetical protein